MMIRLCILVAVCISAMGQSAYPVNVGTISNLVAIVPGNIRSVYVAGHTTTNDGGGGIFVWNATSTASTNYGTVFQYGTNATGRWIRNDAIANKYNAKWFGLAGDGTDEGTRIASAILTATNKTLFFPKGVYGSSITLTIYQNTHIQGEPWGGYYGDVPGLTNSAPSTADIQNSGLTVFKLMGNVPMFTNDQVLAEVKRVTTSTDDGRGTVTQRVYNASIRHVVLDGVAAARGRSDCDLLKLTDAWSITLEGVKFYRPRGYKVHLRNCNDITMRSINSYGLSYTTTGSKGYFLDGCGDMHMESVVEGGTKGPGLWINAEDGWKSSFTHMDLGDNSTSVYGQGAFVSSVTTNAMTLSNDPELETGAPFTFFLDPATNGVLSANVTLGKRYFAIRWATNLYSFNDSLPDALAGTPDTITDAGTTMMVNPGGPNVPLYLSGGARENTFVNVRADSGRQGGIVLNNASYNVFTATKITRAGYVDGTTNDLIRPGYWVIRGSSNILDASIISDSQIPFRTDVGNNIIGSLVVRNYATGIVAHASTIFQQPRAFDGDVSTGALTVQPPDDATPLQVTATNNATMAIFRRNGSITGTNYLKLSKSDLARDMGVFTDDAQNSIFAWEGNAANRTLMLGADFITGTPYLWLRSGRPTGTDKTGYDLHFGTGGGTGNATPGQLLIDSTVPTTSGTGSQNVITNIAAFTTGNQLLRGALSLYDIGGDPSSLTNGMLWNNGGAVKARISGSTVTLGAGGGGSAPTGNGFGRVTSGAWDAAGVELSGAVTTSGSAVTTLTTNQSQQKVWLRTGTTNEGVFSSHTFWPGNNVNISTTNTSGAGTNLDISFDAGSGVNRSTRVEVMEEFMLESSVGPNFTLAASGGTGTSYAGGIANHVGIANLRSGTGVGNYASLYQNRSMKYFGFGEVRFEWNVAVDTLNGGGEEFETAVGLADTRTDAEQAEGVYFLYNISSTYWQIVTADNSTRTTTTTATAVVADQWYKLAAVINAAGTSVEFFIDGTSVGTHTTNIPTNSARLCGPLAECNKTVGTVTNFYMYYDYFWMSQTVSR